jgi:SAM-dependent methyltransferase
LPVVVGDVSRQPFGCFFDMVGAFDVLEHIPDDEAACRDVFRLLRPGGCFLGTVPAHPSLWSSFDEVSCHCRRYTEASLQKILTRVGFQVNFLSPFMSILYPIMLVSRRHDKPKQAQDGAHRAASRDLRVIPVLNEVLRLALVPDAALLRRRVHLHWGTSLIAVATRP